MIEVGTSSQASWGSKTACGFPQSRSVEIPWSAVVDESVRSICQVPDATHFEIKT